MNRKIVLTGATGLIGKNLHKKLLSQGNKVTIFTRNRNAINNIISDSTEIVEWDYNKPELWKDYIEGKDVIIHLAGANLAGKRWNDNYKKEIYNSRILSTRNLVNAIKDSKAKPELFITTSAVGIYGDRGDEQLAEETGSGDDFLARVCIDWEREAAKVEEFGVQRVSLRIAPVLSLKEGLLKRFLLPFKLFVGGPLGNRKQWLPWIHEDDITRIFIHTLNERSLMGAVNSSAPNPIRMKEFTTTLGKVMNRPAIFPVPKFILQLFAGEIANPILSSQKISVKKLINSGFNFEFDNLEKALRNLLGK